MRKTGKLSIAIAMILAVAACSSKTEKMEKRIIEYGDDIKPSELLKLDKEDIDKTSLDIDTKIVGLYHVEVQGKMRTKKKFDIQVKDTKLPVICLKAKKPTYTLSDKIPYENNIKYVKDEIDGNIENIKKVTQKEYKDILEQVRKKRDEINKREFLSKDDLKKIKEDKAIPYSVILATSNIKKGKEGTYTVTLAAVDRNFNVTDKTFEIVVNKKKAKKSKTEEKTANNGASMLVSEKEQSSYASSTATPSVNNPVASAAIARIGSNMSCDELVSAAYIASGKISGSNPYDIGFISANVWTGLGTPVARANARAGDIVYYADGGVGSFHVAVYLGNNQAVHGGFQNRNVVRYSVDIGSGPNFYRMPDTISWDDIALTMYGKDYVDMIKGNNSNSGNITNQQTPATGENSTGSDEGMDTTPPEIIGYAYELNINDKTMYLQCPVDVEDLVHDYFDQTIDEATFLAQVSQKGCSVK